MTILIYAAVAVVLFVAGKLYGARVEAKAVAEYLKVRASFTTDSGKLYTAVVADIKADVSSVSARVRKAL